jgi:hypothetical protein
MSRPSHPWLWLTSLLWLLLLDESNATVLEPLDLRQLVMSSSEIVIGRVDSTRSYWNAARTRILTEVTIRVEESIHGAPAKRIVLTQLGGEVDGVRVTVPGCPTFRVGEESLLFVWRSPKGLAQVTGLAQGKFEVVVNGNGQRMVTRASSLEDATSTIQSTPPEQRIGLDDFLTAIRSIKQGHR